MGAVVGLLAALLVTLLAPFFTPYSAPQALSNKNTVLPANGKDATNSGEADNRTSFLLKGLLVLD